jgi:tetratricopeptide (TPR) repeat protein
MTSAKHATTTPRRVAHTLLSISLLLLMAVMLARPTEAGLTRQPVSKRIALVMGNDNYQHATVLHNARRDAEAIAKALQASGFTVVLKEDLTLEGMKAALRSFKSQVSAGDDVVFYYSGHGVQFGGTNYLIPIDLSAESEEQVADETVELQRLLNDMQEQKARFTLAIIDACRNNPFAQVGRTIGGRGLAPVTPATGEMVMFSAGANQEALDRLGVNDREQNGVFTRVLLKEMATPGVSADRMLRVVREKVVELAQQVGHDQVPAIYDQTIGDFYFRGAADADSAAAVAPVAAQAAARSPAPPVATPAPAVAAAKSAQSSADVPTTNPGAGSGPAAAPAGPSVSKGLTNLLGGAQNDMRANNFTDSIAKLRAAQAMPDKTAYDQHAINSLLAYDYVKITDYADAAPAMEAELGDGFVPQADIPLQEKLLAQVNYQIKNYDKTIQYGQRAIGHGVGDEATSLVVAQAYYLKGDWTGTLRFVDNLIDTQIKAGATPAKQSLLLAAGACGELKDFSCLSRRQETLVTYYPTPEAWHQLLHGMNAQVTENDDDALQLYRLMSEVDALQSAQEYTEMGRTALVAGSLGEAKATLEKGMARGVFTDPADTKRAQRLLETVEKTHSADEASLPRLASEAAGASTGAKNAALGLAYFSYGQYEKAEDALLSSFAKGGLHNEADTRLLLGIVQLKAGSKADATASFRQVRGNPVLEKLARLWAIRAR